VRKTLIGLALASTVLATPALARDGSPYIGIDGGVVFGGSLGSDFDLDDDDDFDDDERDAFDLGTDRGWEAALLVGYDFGAFRLEAEGSYKNLNVDRLRTDLAGFDLDDVTPGVQNRVDLNGDLKVKSLMANALVDLGPDDGLQFFAGGGIGVGWADFEGSRLGEDNSFIDDSDSALAWQLIAGARFPVSDSVDLGVKYKYFNLDNLKIRNIDTNRIDTGLSSHSVLASLVFNFGGSRPIEAAPPPPPPAPAPMAPPPAPQTKICPDGSEVGVYQNCPMPPPPMPTPQGERG
jgi:OOP family OmpA-OmpF porin